MLNDYESSYEDLLESSGKPSMNLRRTRTISIKIYETINNLNPEYMKNLFIICIVKLIKRRDNNTTHSAFTCSKLTIENS